MDKDNIIRDAQYRKSLGIAFFNATNSAIETLKTYPHMATEKGWKKALVEVRDWYLDEHKNYYATVIAPVGLAYKPQETIDYLNGSKDLTDLKGRWLLLSEDERRDDTIIAVMKGLKTKLQPKPATNEKAQ